MSTIRVFCSMLALALSLAGTALIATSADARVRADMDPVRDPSRDIAEYQAILEHAGYLAPGDYREGEHDASTRAALQTFQSRHGLAPTGSMNHETMTQLSSHAETVGGDADAMAEVVDQGGLVLKGVRFDPDTAHLTRGSRATLDRVARSLASSPDGRFQVAGHTDSTNTDAYNLKLSKARSAAVCEYLVDQGVDSSRLKEKGYGESHPIADNATAAGRATNRRVDITPID